VSGSRFKGQFGVADEICGRWASGQGTGLPNPQIDDPRASVVPLPDDLAIEVDRIIRRSPRDLRKLLDLFYRKRLTFPRVEDIAAHLGVRERRTVYVRLHEAHVYLLFKLNEHGTLDRYQRRRVRDIRLRLRRSFWLETE